VDSALDSVGTAAFVGAAPVVMAQGQQIFQWTGRVDREVQIVMRGDQLSTRRIGATEPNWARGQAMSDLPRQDGVVRVQVLQGRGNVAVIQQPNAQHGFTAVVRIQDPASGSDPYRLVGYWEGYSNGEDVGWPGRGRGRDRNYPDNNGGYGDRGNGRYGDRDNGRNGNRTMLHWSGIWRWVMWSGCASRRNRSTRKRGCSRAETSRRSRWQHGHAARQRKRRCRTPDGAA
jgi:hypothetical protein